MARASGMPKAVFQKKGDVVRLAPGKPGKLAEVRAGRLVLDGDSGIQADVVSSTRLWNFGVMLDLESPPSGSVVTARP